MQLAVAELAATHRAEAEVRTRAAQAQSEHAAAERLAKDRARIEAEKVSWSLVVTHAVSYQGGCLLALERL